MRIEIVNTTQNKENVPLVIYNLERVYFECMVMRNNPHIAEPVKVNYLPFTKRLDNLSGDSSAPVYVHIFGVYSSLYRTLKYILNFKSKVPGILKLREYFNAGYTEDPDTKEVILINNSSSPSLICSLDLARTLEQVLINLNAQFIKIFGGPWTACPWGNSPLQWEIIYSDRQAIFNDRQAIYSEDRLKRLTKCLVSAEDTFGSAQIISQPDAEYLHQFLTVSLNATGRNTLISQRDTVVPVEMTQDLYVRYNLAMLFRRDSFHDAVAGRYLLWRKKLKKPIDSTLLLSTFTEDPKLRKLITNVKASFNL